MSITEADVSTYSSGNDINGIIVAYFHDLDVAEKLSLHPFFHPQMMLRCLTPPVDGSVASAAAP